MDAKKLADELRRAFLSAHLAWDGHGAGVIELLEACANNAATGLADRTISNDLADRLAKLELDLELFVAECVSELEEDRKDKIHE